MALYPAGVKEQPPRGSPSAASKPAEMSTSSGSKAVAMGITTCTRRREARGLDKEMIKARMNEREKHATTKRAELTKSEQIPIVRMTDVKLELRGMQTRTYEIEATRKT